MLERMIRAARLDIGVYEELERDTTANGQALTVVVIVSILSGLGFFIASVFGGDFVGAIVTLIVSVLIAIVGWALFAFITYFVGTRLFGGTATWGELLRTIGFAYTPLVIGIIPCLGFIGWIWFIITSIVAIRQSLDVTTGKAVLTAIIAAVVYLILAGIVFGILSAVGLGFGALTGQFGTTP